MMIGNNTQNGVLMAHGGREFLGKAQYISECSTLDKTNCRFRTGFDRSGWYGNGITRCGRTRESQNIKQILGEYKGSVGGDDGEVWSDLSKAVFCQRDTFLYP